MKRLGIIEFSAWPVFVAMLLCGCANLETKYRTQWDEQYYWKRDYPSDFGMSTEAVNKEASDPAAKRESRCEMVFRLFEYYIRPGYSSEQVGAVLRNARWLHEARVDPMGGLGGWVPVFLGGANELVFTTSLFPDTSGWSDWNIYFVLSGIEGGFWEEPQQKAMSFLKGTLPDKRVRLQEFALCYPKYKIERFTDRGVGLMLWNIPY